MFWQCDRRSRVVWLVRDATCTDGGFGCFRGVWRAFCVVGGRVARVECEKGL